MTYLIKFLDSNVKYAVYTGGNIRVIYNYLDIIVVPITLTTSGHRSRRAVPLSSVNNDTESLKTVISAFHMRQNSICEFCGRIGHKYDA